MLIEGFHEIRQPVSWEKAGYMANSKELDEELGRQWDLPPSARSAGARLLGTDAADGRWRVAALARQREKEALQGAARAHILHKAGAAVGNVVRAGPTAKAVWGTAVAGIPDGRMHRLRVAALRSEGRLPAGSTIGLRFRSFPRAAHRDPMIIGTVLIAKQHAYCVWHRLPGQSILRTVGEAAVELPGKRNPWKLCRDPIEAFTLSMRRVGWTVRSYKDVVDDLGRSWDMEKISPGLVAHLARRSAQRAVDIEAMQR